MDVIKKKKDFTREEKILCFNDLRNGYSELVKRLKDYGENQETISVNKRSPHRRRDTGYKYDDGESFLQSSEDERNDEVNDDSKEKNDKNNDNDDNINNDERSVDLDKRSADISQEE